MNLTNWLGKKKVYSANNDKWLNMHGDGRKSGAPHLIYILFE
jgi:hypothetical protein